MPKKSGKIKKLARGGSSGGLPVDEDKWAGGDPNYDPWNLKPSGTTPTKVTGKGSGKYKGKVKSYKTAGKGSSRYKGKAKQFQRTAKKTKTWNYS